MSGGMTPNQTGILLLILLAFALICGTIDDHIRKKKEEKHLSDIANQENNDIPVMALNQKTGKILFNVNGTWIPGGKHMKYKSSKIYRLRKNKANVIKVSILKSRKRKERKIK